MVASSPPMRLISAGIIEGDHEGVLVGVALFEAVLISGYGRVGALGQRFVGVEALEPGAVGVPRANPAGLRIEERLPVLGLLEELLVLGFVAEAAGELGDGEVVACVFEGARGGAGVLVDGDVAELEVIGEEGALFVVVRTFAGFGCGFDHVLERGLARRSCARRRHRRGEQDGRASRRS